MTKRKIDVDWDFKLPARTCNRQIRLFPHYWDKLAERAYADKRTINDYLNSIIGRWYDDNSYNPDPNPLGRKFRTRDMDDHKKPEAEKKPGPSYSTDVTTVDALVRVLRGDT